VTANVPVEALLGVAASRSAVAYAAWLSQQPAHPRTEAATRATDAASINTQEAPQASPQASEGGVS
jgi:hypothetical protein